MTDSSETYLALMLGSFSKVRSGRWNLPMLRKSLSSMPSELCPTPLPDISTLNIDIKFNLSLPKESNHLAQR